MRISRLLMPAVTLAGALALAGCGGGSDTPGQNPPPGLEPGEASNPVGGKIYTCDKDHDGNCDFDPDNPPTEAEAEDAGITITDAPPPPPPAATQTSITRDADAAKKAAEDAYKEVTEASKGTGMDRTHKTGYADVQGVSADATANAMAILDAEPKIETALANAKKALAEAEGLDEDAVGKDRLVASIKRDITAIEGYQETVERIAKELRGSKSTARKASHWGTKAAKDLDEQLVDGSGAINGPDGTAMQLSEAGDNVLFHGNSRPDGAKNFRNADVNGETLLADGNDLAKSDQGAVVTANGTDLGIAGIPAGQFVCVSASGCAAVESGKEIGDGWRYIVGSGNNPGHWYVKEGTSYGAIAYLEWGMWIDTGASDNQRIQSWAGPGSGSDGGVTRGTFTENDDLDGTATYEGEAEGLSTFRASTGGADPAAVRSGHFTADVKLEATFDGTNSKLEGMIDGFDGPAVNTGWKIEIEEGTLSAGGTGASLPTVKGGGRFTHQTYGEDGQRPTGIVGQFGKNFSDGAVAGVYHAD